MVKCGLITITQALTLKELGFNECSCHAFWYAGKKIRRYSVDEVIDWLRRKYNIVIYNKIEPFVDPTDDTHKNILFKYGVKRCDVNHLGWNGRMDLGTTRLNTNVYSLKREAINIALKYIKNQKK